MPRNKTCRTCVPALDNLHKHVGRRRGKAVMVRAWCPNRAAHNGLTSEAFRGCIPAPAGNMAPAALSGCSLFASPLHPAASAQAQHCRSVWANRGVWCQLPALVERVRIPHASAVCCVFFFYHASRFCTAVALCSSRCGIRGRQELAHLSVLIRFHGLLRFPHHFDLIAGKMNTVFPRLQKKD